MMVEKHTRRLPKNISYYTYHVGVSPVKGCHSQHCVDPAACVVTVVTVAFVVVAVAFVVVVAVVVVAFVVVVVVALVVVVAACVACVAVCC